MHYLDMGEGEVVVLIHGLGSKKEMWKHQYELSEQYRLVIPDVRGHGESNETEDLTVERFAKDILSLLDTLEIEKAHFCGLSMGGVITQEIYRLAPERVLTLTLSNTFSYAPSYLGAIALGFKVQQLQTVTADEYTLQAAKRCLYNKHSTHVKETQEALLFKRDTIIQSSYSVIQSNYLPMLPFVTKPALVIGSLEDEIVPVIAAIQTKLFLPRAELKLFSQTGHAPNVERKELFNRTLLKFLNKYRNIS